jgi:rhodanese-related sulfurtransferase
MFVLAVALVACSVGPAEPAAAPPVEAAAAGVRDEVDVAEFAEAHAAGARVIDVRTPEEFASGHVPGAINVPVDTVDPADPVFASHPKDQPLYLVCRSGRRSGLAADELAAAGFHAVNVAGGTLAWVEAGHPVE